NWTPCNNKNLDGLCSGCIVKNALDICYQAIRYYPLETTYQLAVKILAFDPDLTDTEPLLVSWLGNFSDSIIALQNASQLYVKLQNWRMAEHCIDRLKKVSGNSSYFRDAYQNYATYRSISLCKSGGNILARVSTLLNSVENQAEWYLVLQNVIRWIAADGDRKQKNLYADLLAAYHKPYLMFYYCHCILPSFSKRKLPRSVQKQLNVCESLLDELPIIASLSDSGWHFSPDFDWLLESVAPASVIKKIENCPDLYYRLLLFYLKLENGKENLPPNAYKTIARYLSAGQAHVAEFWAFRGLQYYQECDDSTYFIKTPEVVEECFKLAFYYGLDDIFIINRLKRITSVSKEEMIDGIKKLTPQMIDEITCRESKRTREKDLKSAVKLAFSSNVNSGLEVLLKANLLKMRCETAAIDLDEDLTVPQLARIYDLLELAIEKKIERLPEDLKNTIMKKIETLDDKIVKGSLTSDRSFIIRFHLEIITVYVRNHNLSLE
ncbi:MAG: hypothetical protein Q9M22_00985, partial [Mariprofundaceae bacterium]|nr:hypothetical protein [Mariprofundaceae bacterium]